MKKRTQERLFTPIIGRVATLNEYILRRRGKAKKVVQYNYIDDLIKQCFLLFKYAMRQLSGKDYVKRSMELCEEIQCSTYLIARLHGFTPEECAWIDVAVDEIIDGITNAAKSQNENGQNHHTKNDERVG